MSTLTIKKVSLWEIEAPGVYLFAPRVTLGVSFLPQKFETGIPHSAAPIFPVAAMQSPPKTQWGGVGSQKGHKRGANAYITRPCSGFNNRETRRGAWLRRLFFFFHLFCF